MSEVVNIRSASSLEKERIAGRYKRFASETDADAPLSVDNRASKRSFYQGAVLETRMNVVRESINYTRQNWHRYDEFVTDLEYFLLERFEKHKLDQSFVQHLHFLLSRKTDWGVSSGDNFALIRFYTSKTGYEMVFKWINREIFRSDESSCELRLIRLAVFLIELINIDLFNLCLEYPCKHNFEGIVYRGIGMTSEQLAELTTLMERPLQDRYIGVPLSLQSATLNRHLAVEYMRHAARDNSTLLTPVLFRCHIVGLKREHLALYTQRYPNNQVSTICAVSIADISEMPEEEEVILRGAFYQLLSLSTEAEEQKEVYTLVEALVVNSNRDHISTAHLGPDDAPARTLFRNLVALTRYEFAVEYCLDWGMEKDNAAYQSLLENTRSNLKACLDEHALM